MNPEFRISSNEGSVSSNEGSVSSNVGSFRIYHDDTLDARTFYGGKNLGTHKDTFHCDEVLAIALLHLTKEYQNANVIRTRDDQVLKQCTIVVDVGGEYDPNEDRYDHHQRGFDETMDGYKTKLSSAGLIYKHFGIEILENIIKQISQESSTLENAFIDKIFKKVYEGFIEHIDANDNGIAVSKGPHSYRITTSLPDRVRDLNPPWYEESDSQDMERRFYKAYQLVSSEFKAYVIKLVKSMEKARPIVEKAFANRFNNYWTGEIIILDRFCPFYDELERLEAIHNCMVKYVLFGDSKKWKIRAVPISDGSFENRLTLPESWRGLRKDDLEKICGIENSEFVHANGFIGGANTKEAALQMAISALREADKSKG
tara:strand:+ start:215 stop:1330 length:1116 start_codon:yes stop_codon:yes gene_type:complete